ncbi:MAG: AAA family ATPase [Gemmatimonadaceae bacterium]|nr:AAA family ATPase [Gemmatimonadaceae bacterium]
MLTKLTLKNFRGFEEHELPLRRQTIIVGRNNAGKSTIVEALRLVALFTSRLPTGTFRPPPEWLDQPGAGRGIFSSLDGTSFDFDTAHHRYAPPPSVITAEFSHGAVLRLYVGDSQIFASAQNQQGRLVGDRASARLLALPPVLIMPQIGPLALEERLLNSEYVRRMQGTPLASQHFRNQLHLDAEGFERLQKLVEDTWPGVRIDDLLLEDAAGIDASDKLNQRLLRLMIRNDDFVGEAARMGTGLQMWLQTMWLLARASSDATVILDEPDVYMHPDLERRLVHVVSGRYAQSIIATHSAEIMAEVQPDEILVVDRSRSSSSFASTLPAVQGVLDALGSVHNLQLARLWTARRLLLVEGDDIAILGPIHSTLFPNCSLPLASLPRAEVGGWGGWERVMGSADVMRNSLGEQIMVYALFDRDFRTPTQIQDRLEKAKRARINAHIWQRKEIENFLLVPSAIIRVLSARVARREELPTAQDVEGALDAIEAELWASDTEVCLVTSFGAEVKNNTGTALRKAREYADPLRATREGRWALAGGKQMLSQLSKWTQDRYGVSLSALALAHALQPDEIAAELKSVLTAVETGTPLE